MRKAKILLFYGRIRELIWDPYRYQWANKKPLIEYTTKSGKEFFQKRKPVDNIPQLIWNDTLPMGFTFRWKANWEADRASKESELVWQIWQHAVAVNEWRVKIFSQIKTKCLTCCSRTPESFLHLFWACPQAKTAWTFALKTRGVHLENFIQ